MENKWCEFFLCLFLGFLGIHKFYKQKYIMGILYLLTCGLFTIGWFIDIIIILKNNLSTSKSDKNIPNTEYEEYEYNITNTNQKELKRIYNKDSETVYLKAYKDNTAIKVVSEKEEIIGDISPNDVKEVLKKHITSSLIVVNHDLNNDGEMVYTAYIFGNAKKIGVE